MVPYLGRAVDLSVKVARRVEIVDHVGPGVLVAGLGAYLAFRASRDAAPAWPEIAAGGVCFLAGFWVTATHVPLLADAGAGKVSWGAALWHASTGLPMVGLALWVVLRPSVREPL